MAAVVFWGYLLSLGSILHPLYISVSTLHYNSTEQQLEVTIKVFVDDFEEGLDARYAQSFNLGRENELTSSDSLITNYLKENLQIHINDSPLSLEFLGKELDAQVVWLYLHAPMPSSVQKIWVRNKLLMDTFDEQTNLINMRIAEEKRSFILTLKKKEDVATF